MTKTEAIEILQSFREMMIDQHGCPISDAVYALDMAIETLKQPEQRWIPVTEQTLPKHNSVVVVCGEKGTWDFGTYRGYTPNHINFWNWKKNTVKEVHWWMYKSDALPKPYERREKSNADVNT